MRPIDADELHIKLLDMEFPITDTILDAMDLCTVAPPPNDPLTLEELREMPPYEWCWIDRKPKPGYYCKFKRYTNEKSFSCGWPGSDIFVFDYEDYGKDWLAYRRKPEEGTT